MYLEVCAAAEEKGIGQYLRVESLINDWKDRLTK
jgi:hypothetical protein